MQAYRVWSLSWKDVQSVFNQQGDYYTNSLEYLKMPSGAGFYKKTVDDDNMSALKPDKMSAMELLMRYLEMEGNTD